MQHRKYFDLLNSDIPFQIVSLDLLTKMATGFSRTLEGGHDAVYDYCCTPCTQDKLNAEASFYCKNCSKLFCDICLRYHDKIHERHEVLGRAEVANWEKVKSVTPVMMCKEHLDKEEEMYCGDHDLTCCHICINIYHRACKQVHHVSTVAKRIQKTSEFQSFLTNAASTQTSLRNLLHKRVRNTELLQKVRTEITSSFKDIRKSFNQFIDNIEKDSTTEMDILISILQRKVQSDIDACLDFENQIQKFLDDIKNLGNQCEEFAFQCFKKCGRKLSNANELLLSIKDKEYQLKFTPDLRIQQFQSSLKTFGKIEISPQTLHPDYVYTVDNIQSYNVKTKTDTKKCTISGICQLSEGQVAIADHNNNKVKLLSSLNYSVTAELDLPSKLCEICSTTGTKLIATTRLESNDKLKRSELHFINAAAGHLTHMEVKKLEHECSGIVWHHGQLFVSSKTAVYKYDLSGQKLGKLYEDKSVPGRTVYRFAISDDGNRIYVTNPELGCLLTIGKLGHQLAVLTDSDLEDPTGVCVAENGAVLVCGFNSDTVIQVDSRGKKKMVTMAKKSDKVCKPMSVCYHRTLKQLLIGQKSKDNILVLQLK